MEYFVWVYSAEVPGDVMLPNIMEILHLKTWHLIAITLTGTASITIYWLCSSYCYKAGLPLELTILGVITLFSLVLLLALLNQHRVDRNSERSRQRTVIEKLDRTDRNEKALLNKAYSAGTDTVTASPYDAAANALSEKGLLLRVESSADLDRGKDWCFIMPDFLWEHISEKVATLPWIVDIDMKVPASITKVSMNILPKGPDGGVLIEVLAEGSSSLGTRECRISALDAYGKIVFGRYGTCDFAKDGKARFHVIDDQVRGHVCGCFIEWP